MHAQARFANMFCIHPISPETSFDVNMFECLVPNDTAPYVRKKSVRRKKHREDDIIATWALGTPNACGLNRLLSLSLSISLSLSLSLNKSEVASRYSRHLCARQGWADGRKAVLSLLPSPSSLPLTVGPATTRPRTATQE